MLIQARLVKKREKIEVRNPYTGNVTGAVSALGERDADRAVRTAKKYCFSLSCEKRKRILQKTANALIGKKEEFAELITKEIGISMKDSLHEVDRTYNVMVLSAQEAKDIEKDIPSMKFSYGLKGYQTKVVREPVGVVLCITPFNHPLNQIAHKISPALAANNAVILKPSEKSPLTAIKFAKLLLQNGLPEEMLQVVTGHNSVVGRALIQHPQVDMINFTGSTSVGEYIMKSCGIKKLFLELGGNDAFIVLHDANIEEAARVAINGAFSNSGQRCTSIKRIIVLNEIASDFAALLVKNTEALKVGDPADRSTDIGTVVNEDAAIMIEGRIKEAVKDGAKLLTGGKRVRAQVWPAVLDHVDPDSELVREETFGPVAPIIRVSSIDEAIETANATKYGLSAGIMTKNIKRAYRLAKRLNVGGVRINQAPSFRNELIPFGGNKMSGFGRGGVKYAVMEMTNIKAIISRKSSR